MVRAHEHAEEEEDDGGKGIGGEAVVTGGLPLGGRRGGGRWGRGESGVEKVSNGTGLDKHAALGDPLVASFCDYL